MDYKALPSLLPLPGSVCQPSPASGEDWHCLPAVPESITHNRRPYVGTPGSGMQLRLSERSKPHIILSVCVGFLKALAARSKLLVLAEQILGGKTPMSHDGGVPWRGSGSGKEGVRFSLSSVGGSYCRQY